MYNLITVSAALAMPSLFHRRQKLECCYLWWNPFQGSGRFLLAWTELEPNVPHGSGMRQN